MNHSQIKADAKKILNGNMWNLWKPMLIYVVISYALNNVLGIFYEPKTSVYKILNILLNIVILPMSVGIQEYCLKIIRNEEYNLSLLTKYYSKFFKVAGIAIIMVTLMGLGFSLFVIPGIILFLCYAFSFNILIDNENMSCNECLKASIQMTKGYKGDLFVFLLSFIGWFILSLFVLPLIYVLPYFQLSLNLYYEVLRKGGLQPNNNGVVPTPQPVQGPQPNNNGVVTNQP